MGSFLSEKSLSFIAIHITVFLWGFTAILGKLISYGSFLLVWHRMTITFLVYCLLPQTYQGLSSLTFKQIIIYAAIGVVVCIHWITFYGSIKLGDSASVTLACLGTVAFFSSIFEPIFLGIPHSVKDIMMGLFVLVGVLFIYVSLPDPPNSHVNYKWAVIVGLFSAMLASLFTILNKKYIQQASPLVISAIEMASGSLFLWIVVPLMYGNETIWYPPLSISHHLTLHSFRDGSLDLVWVLILSILCTNLTFYLSTYSLSHLSAFTINLTCNLEPIYGILLGALFFHENQSLNHEFYVGTTVILTVILLNPLIPSSVHPDTFLGKICCCLGYQMSEEEKKRMNVNGSYSDVQMITLDPTTKQRSTTGTEDHIDEEESLLRYHEEETKLVKERWSQSEGGYEGDGDEEDGKIGK